jgi:hypothetical protein
MWARLINIVLGVWLMLAPWVLRYDLAVARTNDIWVGILVALAALVALAWPPARWANTALGAWLIIAPFALGYAAWDAAALNSVIVGALVLAVSLIPSLPGVVQRAPRAGAA